MKCVQKRTFSLWAFYQHLLSPYSTQDQMATLTHSMHFLLTSLTSNYCCLVGWENWHVEHSGNYIYYTAFFCHPTACLLRSCQSFFYALIKYIY